MEYTRRADACVIRFDAGDRFPGPLLEMLESESIRGGTLAGIGAVEQCCIAFFDVESREYRDRVLDEQLEVLALVGNVARHAGAPIVHAHITLGRPDYSTLGGHLRWCVVRPTLELTLRVSAEPLARRIDPQFGLPTLNLESPEE